MSLSWIGPIVPLTGWWTQYLFVYCLPWSKIDLAFLRVENEKMKAALTEIAKPHARTKPEAEHYPERVLEMRRLAKEAIK